MVILLGLLYIPLFGGLEKTSPSVRGVKNDELVQPPPGAL